MIAIINQNIKITKGDSAYIILSSPDLKDQDDIKVQVRDAPEGNILFEGTLVQIGDDVVWHIRPEDTEELDVGKYSYDVRIQRNNEAMNVTDTYHVTWVNDFEVVTRVTMTEE